MRLVQTNLLFFNFFPFVDIFCRTGILFFRIFRRTPSQFAYYAFSDAVFLYLATLRRNIEKLRLSKNRRFSMTQFSLKKGCLSGSTLKIIAIIAMAIDHFAASIILYGILMQQNPTFLGHPISMTIPWWNIYQVMRFIGRIGFPIFCFLLIEGFLHTSSKKKYATRLFLFALVSEFPFDYALFNTPFAPGYQNVFFTLFLGLLTIWAIDTVSHKEINPNLQWIIKILIAATGCLTAWLLQTDYDYKGIILILLLYLFHDQKFLCTLVSCMSLLWEAPACLAFIPINLYNGKRGISLKYFFYLFYPVHLLLYGLILHFCFLN